MFYYFIVVWHEKVLEWNQHFCHATTTSTNLTKHQPTPTTLLPAITITASNATENTVSPQTIPPVHLAPLRCATNANTNTNTNTNYYNYNKELQLIRSNNSLRNMRYGIEKDLTSLSANVAHWIVGFCEYFSVHIYTLYIWIYLVCMCLAYFLDYRLDRAF